ncbi:sigma 54-interacting transcriptional regulator [Runella sp.]|uniref:sigma-54 interaction domain-containing protein n=1 Tax=Runella sp. TaxID=1960881 RepID=UPI0030193323
MKILISWYAKNNDFDKEGNVNIQGPTMQFHQYFYNGYDKHLIMSSRSEIDRDPLMDKLVREINIRYKERVMEKHLLNIADVIGFQEIKTKVETLLLKLKDAEIDIFFSPGTSVMQLSWFVCHQTLGLKTRLLQTREGRFSKKSEPDLMELKVEHSSVPMSAILSEQKQLKADADPDYLISDSIQPVYEKARLIAQTDKVFCLIRGESGTGKEHLAQYLHQQSSRSSKSFVVVNCSALSDTLLESRLFGYVKGAYTDAKEDKKGILEEANGGTVFLDEIGDISPYMQQSLLRVLQNGEILAVGATKSRKVDVRIIAATHKNLEQLCEAGNFRWDLYYRLSVVELTLPTLQERGVKEKQALIDFFMGKIRRQLKKSKRLKISKEALMLLLEYPFRGNIRELENVITSLYVFCDEDVQVSNLPQKLLQKSSKLSASFQWDEVEKDLIVRALDFYQGNQAKTCKAIGYGSINTLKKKMRAYGVDG